MENDIPSLSDISGKSVESDDASIKSAPPKKTGKKKVVLNATNVDQIFAGILPDQSKGKPKSAPQGVLSQTEDNTVSSSKSTIDQQSQQKESTASEDQFSSSSSLASKNNGNSVPKQQKQQQQQQQQQNDQDDLEDQDQGNNLPPSNSSSRLSYEQPHRRVGKKLYTCGKFTTGGILERHAMIFADSVEEARELLYQEIQRLGMKATHHVEVAVVLQEVSLDYPRVVHLSNQKMIPRPSVQPYSNKPCNNPIVFFTSDFTMNFAGAVACAIVIADTEKEAQHMFLNHLQTLGLPSNFSTDPFSFKRYFPDESVAVVLFDGFPSSLKPSKGSVLRAAEAEREQEPQQQQFRQSSWIRQEEDRVPQSNYNQQRQQQQGKRNRNDFDGDSQSSQQTSKKRNVSFQDRNGQDNDYNNNQEQANNGFKNTDRMNDGSYLVRRDDGSIEKVY